MQTRLDLLTRALPEFGQDRGLTKQVPVGTGENSFGNTLTRVVNEVSATRDNASEMVQAFANGENVELHQVMAAQEEAGIALDMMIELRNKVVEAYRSVISMQS
ncbi:MAG: flagellar hook-basal body complex protein FliE [Gemmatimonadota bacterium]|jgi:flagellar hook-basal body complex protein FliE